jgi:hypothetical protein
MPNSQTNVDVMTAVEWLIFHWLELDKKYYAGEIGRIDYRNRRDAIQSEAKEMENEHSKKYAEFAIICDRMDMRILNFDDYMKLDVVTEYRDGTIERDESNN